MEATKKTPVKKTETKSSYTVSDLAKDSGLPSASVARRILRAAQIKKPKDGWVWPDKAAAKDALEAVRRAQTGAAK